MTKDNNNVASLKRLLGDTYLLYVKTHAYHWNVTGPNFHALHIMLEGQYTEMWMSLDAIAERIRALGAFAPGSARAMASYATITEDESDKMPSQTMLKNLIHGHDQWLESANAALEIASADGDIGTEDLITPLIGAHQKTNWMLKSSLDA